MVNIRPLNPSDIEELYSISLATGYLGGDASELYVDPKMMGHIYSAPYANLLPEMCFVAEDTAGVAGFVVGTLDTKKFELALESRWWPPLREIYPAPEVSKSAYWSADQKRSHMMHFPKLTPRTVSNRYPAHLHINLLPRLQGQGVATTLLQVWLATAAENGTNAAHVGTNPLNKMAIEFWRASGFQLLNGDLDLPSDRTLWLGRKFSAY